MLAISHPIAQSLRLAQIEDEVLHHITKISHIPQDLATKGKISENKKQISKMQGTLYQLKSKISLEYSVLDKPEFFGKILNTIITTHRFQTILSYLQE